MDPTDEFVVDFKGFSGAKLRYYAYEKDTGCYKIHLSGTDSRRIYASVGHASERDVDTLHYRETGKRLCGKWIDVTLTSRDVAWTPKPHEDDGRGI
uniref:Uncharacterized protein n=2 Tax=Kalmanozyma brasiliensis (strain GHG001) TaxID=1365824 RepID=V5EQ45_KALBG